MKEMASNLDLEGWLGVVHAQMSESWYGISIELSSNLVESDDWTLISRDSMAFHACTGLFMCCASMGLSLLDRNRSASCCILQLHYPGIEALSREEFGGNGEMGRTTVLQETHDL